MTESCFCQGRALKFTRGATLIHGTTRSLCGIPAYSRQLTSVKYGMAMGNGTENCRKAAPYVTDTNEKDGVAKGILRFLSEVE